MTAPITNPFVGWLRCDECGAEADAPCMDEHDKPAIEVCDGRGFRLRDSADKTRRGKCEDAPQLTRDGRVKRTREDPPSETRDAVRKRAKRGTDTKYAPCQCCGDLVRLWGQAATVGRTWCSKPECRRHLYRDKHRRRMRGPTAPCKYCGAERPRQVKARYPTCGGRACALAARREHAKDNPS